jgi:CRP/FNR family transcriptional regulator, anaerobic regulatory protein
MPIRKELDTITDLEAGARVVAAGADLYRQGDVCSTYFIVLNGWIALSVLLDDGSCQILDFALPGAVLGFQSAADAPMYHSARCLSIVRVFAFPRHKLDNIIESNPRLAVLLCRQIIADEARAHDHLTNLGLRGARERIAHLLLEIYVRLRRRLPSEPGETIHLPLSQGHIGQALGLTYVHVSRTLQILREQKIVRFANQKLEIIDPPALLAAAGIELDLLDRRQHVGGQPFIQTTGSSSSGAPTGNLPAGWMPMEDDRRFHTRLGSLSGTREFSAARAA